MAAGELVQPGTACQHAPRRDDDALKSEADSLQALTLYIKTMTHWKLPK